MLCHRLFNYSKMTDSLLSFDNLFMLKYLDYFSVDIMHVAKLGSFIQSFLEASKNQELYKDTLLQCYIYSSLQLRDFSNEEEEINVCFKVLIEACTAISSSSAMSFMFKDVIKIFH